jgi:hypothetical protein
MELPGDVGQLEVNFGSLGDGVNLGIRLVHSLPQMYHGHGNLVGRTQWTSKVMWVKWKACFGLFGDSVNLDAR